MITPRCRLCSTELTSALVDRPTAIHGSARASFRRYGRARLGPSGDSFVARAWDRQFVVPLLEIKAC
jgi:hypothetical protein